MKLEEARECLAQLRGMTNDDEEAHAFEDRFHNDVLRAIADGTAENPAELAAVALKTNDIEFSRWYA